MKCTNAKLNRTWLLAVVASSFFSFTAGAALLGDQGNERCGLGTMIFKGGQSIVSQTSEASSNGIMTNESLSVTTGTSGCSNSGIVMVPQKEQMYANANFEELQVEMSQGKGEVLAGLTQAMGCSGLSDEEFGAFTKVNFEKIQARGSQTPLELMTNLRQAASQNAQIVKSCSSMQI